MRRCLKETRAAGALTPEALTHADNLLKTRRLDALSQVLARAIAKGTNEPVDDYLKMNNRKKVTVRDIDPKAVSTQELYGFVNMATREWKVSRRGGGLLRSPTCPDWCRLLAWGLLELHGGPKSCAGAALRMGRGGTASARPPAAASNPVLVSPLPSSTGRPPVLQHARAGKHAGHQPQVDPAGACCHRLCLGGDLGLLGLVSCLNIAASPNLKLAEALNQQPHSRHPIL
jgi:hypothetical protein